ncbi:FAD-binding oxidoreductase [Kutzneria albida]|nr:FAD-binding oxidoreductase [Kutzneria albida]
MAPAGGVGGQGCEAGRVGLTRRTFLHAAGFGAAAAALSACTPSGSGAPPSSGTTPPPTTSSAAVPPDWPKLRSSLAGKLFLPEDEGYGTAKLAYNPLFDSRTPAAVASCARPEDVQACVGVAASSRIPIAARSGGHSYAGYSTPDHGLVVDLGGMKGVEVRADGTAVIGAGARLIEVYSALADQGRCLPGGSCPTVGIAGLTLGGGVGVLTRKFGLTCDRLVSAQVVTPDGHLRTASADSEPDLYWALRGGGGGNLGIVTSFTFSTEPAPQLTVFQLHFPGGSVAEVLGGWQSFTADAPDELWSTLAVSGGTPPTSRVTGCYVGSASGLAPLLNSLIAKTGAQPTSRYVQGKSYLEAMLWFGGCSGKPVAQCKPSWSGSGALGRESFVATSRVLTKPLDDPAQLASLMRGRTGMDVLIDSLGGAVNRVGAGDTAFPYRSALATAQVYQGATAASARSAGQTVGEVRGQLGDLFGANGYVNYIDPDMPDWAGAYYAGNLARLRQVARKYDPDGMFAFAQGLTKA